MSQKMFLKAIRGCISVSGRRELLILLGFCNLGRYENPYFFSQLHYLRQTPRKSCFMADSIRNNP